jgi:protein phosphatase
MPPIILGGSNHPSTAEGVTSLGLRYAAATDAGIGYKAHNEDRIVIDPDNNLLAVIDGMGGQSCGEQAAEIIAEALRAIPNDIAAALLKAKNDLKVLPSDAGACHSEVRIEKDANGLLTLSGCHGGDVKRLIIEARSALLNTGLPLFHASQDHDLVSALPRKDARVHPLRNQVLQSLTAHTTDVPQIMQQHSLQPGDNMLLLYSDGVSDNIHDRLMVRLSVKKTPAEAVEVVRRLVEKKMRTYSMNRAKVKDMKRDNWSIVAVEC